MITLDQSFDIRRMKTNVKILKRMKDVLGLFIISKMDVIKRVQSLFK